jgi:hypothetical protein
MKDADGTAPISALTVVAARPESQWLKRLGSELPEELHHLVPARTPTDTRTLFRGPSTLNPELPATKETVTGLHTASLVPSARPLAIAAGAAVAAVLGVAAFLVLKAPPEPAIVMVPTAPRAPAEKNPPVDPEPTPVAPAAPVVAAPPSPGPAPEPPPEPEPAPRAVRRDDRVSVKATAPGRVTWKLNGKTVGSGNSTLKLPPGTTKVTAIDGETGGVLTVPVENDAVAFAKIKSGTLIVRAKPWAEVKLGPKVLGTTPLDPLTLPEGRYELMFVREEKTKRQTIEVKGGATATANADMR